jgi:TPR repeat protein
VPENDTDTLQQLNRWLEVNDSHACNEMGALYYHGENGVVQNRSKALEYFLRGAELGSKGCVIHCPMF